MSHLLQELPSPIILAHRGSSRYAPENTLAAFKVSVRQGVDGVELDVRLTADGHVVVIHDANLDHKTNGTGKVADFSLAALEELDAGSHFSPDFSDQKIPTLDQVFETIGRQLLINVELKNLTTHSKALAEKVALIVRRHHLEKHVLFSSFSPLALNAVQRNLPEVPAGLLVAKGRLPNRLSQLAGNFLAYDTLHPHFSDVSPQLVARTHQKRRRVFAYTVNQVSDLRHLIGLGVDGIFTDDPPLAMSVLEKINANL